MIVVEDLHKSFGESHVLKGITTTFETGKTNLIIGQSGSGKTVFLKSLLGLFTPEKGKIFVEGKEIRLLSPSMALKHGIGFLPCERKAEGLSTLLSVRDNIVMASLKKISNPFGIIYDSEVQKTAKKYIDKLQIKISMVFYSISEVTRI